MRHFFAASNSPSSSPSPPSSSPFPHGIAEWDLAWHEKSPHAPCKIAADEIQLWAVDLAMLQSPAHESLCQSLLTDVELNRAARYQNPTQREMYLGGRIGLRILLSAHADIANADLQFAHGSRGKPTLKNSLPSGELNFNYTLSGNKALYAFAWNRQLGIDLETLPRKFDATRLAHRKLSADELKTWRTLPPSVRDAATLACWTRKEAYGKAVGVGIRYYLNRVTLFTAIDESMWQVQVGGLFETPSSPQTLHGIQLGMPFSGVAALMYDGEKIADDKLRANRLCPQYRHDIDMACRRVC